MLWIPDMTYNDAANMQHKSPARSVQLESKKVSFHFIDRPESLEGFPLVLQFFLWLNKTIVFNQAFVVWSQHRKEH